MKEITIGANEEGQRLDKLLTKILNEAPAGFIYKMLRKKNITLNGRKAEGKERLRKGDAVQLYLSDDTLAKFHLRRETTEGTVLAESGILFQDEKIMILNKPSGLLSQKSKPEDDSLNDRMIRYLLQKGILTAKQQATFQPSVCNRLDRNTSGIVLAGISLEGSRGLSAMLRQRSLKKYYLTLVLGRMTEPAAVSAYLTKDTVNNRVRISETDQNGASHIEARYVPLFTGSMYTLLEVELITGKSHQIRAHLAYLGHPVAGDAKYGKAEENRRFRMQYGIQNQFLHAYRVVFPPLTGEWENLSRAEYIAPLPQKMNQAVRELWNVDINADSERQGIQRNTARKKGEGYGNMEQ